MSFQLLLKKELRYESSHLMSYRNNVHMPMAIKPTPANV